MKYRIALVEDDESLGYVLSEYLKINDFEITWIRNGSKVLELLDIESFDLLILDITLPDTNGFEIAEMVKMRFPTLPFIFLTSRSLKIDVLKGFSLGAVDYLKKPIDEEELVTRIRVLLNKVVPPGRSVRTSGEIQIGTYTFYSDQQVLERKGTKVGLTERETSLLFYLASNMNKLCTHSDILNRIWGKHDYFNKKSLNVFVSHLRKYLSQDPSIRIENVRNRGFRLLVEEQNS